jgi:hypothetical protein
MAAKDVLSDLQNQAQKRLDGEKADEASAQSLVDQLGQLQAQMDADSESRYQQGLADGIAQAGKDGEKVFTIDDVNQKVGAVQSQLDQANKQIADLTQQVSDGKDAADKAAAVQSAKTAQLIADLKAKIAASIRSVDISNEALANQLAAEANAPTPVLDDQGKPAVPVTPSEPVPPTAPAQDAEPATKEVPDDPLAPATVPDAPSSVEAPVPSNDDVSTPVSDSN